MPLFSRNRFQRKHRTQKQFSLWLSIVLTAVVLRLSDAATGATAATRSWTLYHSVYKIHEGHDDNEHRSAVDEPSFEPRARITFHVESDGPIDKVNVSMIAIPTAVSIDETDTKNVEPVEENAQPVLKLSGKQVQAMLRAGWYQLKLVPDDNNGDKDAAPPVITTVPACLLRRANFRDELTLTFGPDGKVLSMAYMPYVSPLAPKSCADYDVTDHDKTFTFDSKVSYETAASGMTLRTVLPPSKPPPGLVFTRVANAKNNAGGGGPRMDGGGPEDPPPVDNSPFGFLRRYWYIILPVLIMNLMPPEPPKEARQQQQQQRQQQEEGSSGGGTSAAAAEAPGGGQRAAASLRATGEGGSPSKSAQRRGKRG